MEPRARSFVLAEEDAPRAARVSGMTQEGSESPLAVEVHAAPELAVPLRAGPLRVIFDCGQLRWIRLGEREVLRAVYFALREPTWATVPGRLFDLTIEAEPESFRIRFVSRHRRGPVAFDWEGRIEGGADGRIVYALDGRAESTFLRNRIGLCVLHPAPACAGRPCLIETVDGARRESEFPRLVAPHQPQLALRAIAHEVAPGVEAELRMEGETFETEDQRNWSDDSFKTYGTPLALPMPVEVKEGERLRQSITLCLFGEASEPVREAAALGGALPQRRSVVEAVTVVVEPARLLPRPALGLAGAGLVTLAAADAERLRGLRLDHLRADIRLDLDEWPTALARAGANARLLGRPLELALFLPEEPEPALRALADRARALRAQVASWLVFRASDRVTPDGLATLVRDRLSALDPAALFVGGTDSHFVELNRRRPSRSGLDRFSFALTPQVHAFDDATLVENIATLHWLAETARSFAPEMPLAISPVSLRPRVDPRPQASREPGEPPFSDDPRQATPFAAAWTLGFIASAAEAGFVSLSLFELVGPRGVMGRAGCFPVFDALAEVTAFAGAAVCGARSLRPDRVQALALRSGAQTRLFLANVTGEPHPVRIEGLACVGQLSRLGEAGGSECGSELELAPHAIVRLDL
jgi:D-apionolactonase